METGTLEAKRGSGVDTDDIRVLYVDDERDMLTVLSRLLEDDDESLSIATEPSPLSAVERIECEHFDCVVSDYQMPEMNGIELLELVRELDPDLPFLLFTGQGSEEVASEAISAGVTDYLRKEGGTDEYQVLARQIRTAVERRRAIERFEGFLDSAPDAILVVRADGTIDQVNGQAEAMFGYDADDLVGEPIEVLLPERYRESHVAHRDRYARQPETRPMGADVDLYGLHADGTEFPVDVSLSPVSVGDSTEVMAAVRNISTRKWREEELRERERQLERQNERLDEFASVVSHDLRNPLTVAAGSLQLARSREDFEFLEEADRALERMGALLDDLLKLARDGMTVEDIEPVSLATVAEHSWAMTETEAGTLRLPDEDVVVLADRGRLQQVFENLFQNSVEHGRADADGGAIDTDAGGADDDGGAADDDVDKPDASDPLVVTVGLLPDGFYVEDDGCGIPEERRDAVLTYGHSTSPDGNGFGLAIVQGIVQAHGWKLSVTDGESGGARFEATGVEWA